MSSCREGRFQTGVSGYQTPISTRLRILKDSVVPHCTLTLPGNPLTLRVSSKSGRLGPWVGITGGTGGLKGRARTQKHW